MYITVYLILLFAYISVLFYLACKAGEPKATPSTQLAGSAA
jgi:hypothetical protein